MSIDNARYRKTIVLLIVSLVSLSLLALTNCGQGQADQKTTRSDIINIDAMSVFGSLDRPPVQFQHDLHTEAIAKQGKDCQTCHLQMENGRLSQKFSRLDDSDKDAMMILYHEKCIDCHNQTIVSGLKAGPTICGDCHKHEPDLISSRQPIGFDKSLHHRHIEASGDDCGLCHHEYNEQTKELYYKKGSESTCRDCHKEQAEGNKPSLETAAHWSCLGCHLENDNPDNPVDCAGCHDKQRQMSIKIVEKPERLKRNQPDFKLLSAFKTELLSSKLNTVPFSHIGHERFNNTCRVCHHESMKACSECHTLTGNPAGDGVTLQQAMHDMNSEHSCIGCHNRKKSETECAGCHELMDQRQFSEHSCTICHAGPLPQNLAKDKNRYSSIAQFKPKAKDYKLSFKNNDIPDIVTIGVLSEKYNPAVFPHRDVVNKLMEYIDDSRIATHFHGDEDVVCQGCHHHSPIGAKPPLCESCHGEPFNEADLFKPGLYGAYHRQCLGCHQKMEIEEPSDCVGCHSLKK